MSGFHFQCQRKNRVEFYAIFSTSLVLGKWLILGSVIFLLFMSGYQYTLKQILCLLWHFFFIGWLKTWNIPVKKFSVWYFQSEELYYRKLILMNGANTFVGSYGGNMASWVTGVVFRATHSRSSGNHPYIPLTCIGEFQRAVACWNEEETFPLFYFCFRSF